MPLTAADRVRLLYLINEELLEGVSEVQRLELSIGVVAGQKANNRDIPINGMLSFMFFEVPELDATDTAELKLLDPNARELYASGAKAHTDGTTVVYPINVSRPLSGNTTVRIVCNGQQASVRIFTVVLYYISGLI